VGQLELDAMEKCLAGLGWIGVELERNEEGWLRACGKRPSGQSSLPGLERGRGNPFKSTEGGDGQATRAVPFSVFLFLCSLQ
jgi:hypothetical protein